MVLDVYGIGLLYLREMMVTVAEDVAKQVAEMKFKLQEAERENTTQQGNVSIFQVFGLSSIWDRERSLVSSWAWS